MYYYGYRATRRNVERMGRDGLITLIEDLYGWGDGMSREQAETCDLDQLRALALVQHEQDWSIPKQYEHLYPNCEE